MDRKYLLRSLLALSVMSCTTSTPVVERPASNGTGAAAPTDPLPLEVLDATCQPWTGGVEGSGSGLNYAFILAIHADGVEITTVDLDGRTLKAETARLENGVVHSPAHAAKGDTVRVGVSLSSGKEKSLGAEVDSVALIHFTREAKELELFVPRIRKLPRLAYP